MIFDSLGAIRGMTKDLSSFIDKICLGIWKTCIFEKLSTGSSSYRMKKQLILYYFSSLGGYKVLLNTDIKLIKIGKELRKCKWYKSATLSKLEKCSLLINIADFYE